MQPLEHSKDFGRILWIDSYAVISEGENPLSGVLLGGDVNLGRRLGSILDRVSDEILEELYERSLRRHYRRQPIRRDRRATVLNHAFKIEQDGSQHLIAID